LSIDHPVWHLVDDVRTGRSGGQVLLSQLRASTIGHILIAHADLAIRADQQRRRRSDVQQRIDCTPRASNHTTNL